jgi:hypothetical protein
VAEINFDRPVPELTELEDAETIAALEEGLRQLKAGQGIPIEQLREELAKRCLK